MLLFTAAYCYLSPLLSFAGGIAAAALLGLISARYHYLYIGAAAALALAVSAAAGGVTGALCLGVPLVLLGLSLGMGTRIRLNFAGLLFICTFLYTVRSGMSIIFVTAQNPDALSLNSFYATVKQSIDSLSSLGYNFDPNILAAIDGYMKEIVLIMMRITPAMLIIAGAVSAFILIEVYKRAARRTSLDVAFLSPFEALHIPMHLGIMFLLVALLYSASPEGVFSDAALNVIVILMFMFFACGLSLFDFRLKVGGMKKATRRIFEIAIIPVSYMLMMVPIIAFSVFGLVDSFADFRGRLRKKD